MPEIPYQPASANLARTGYRSWVFALGGIVAGGVGVYAAIGPAAGLIMDMAWQQAASRHPGFGFPMQAGVTDTQILSGVSGEAIAGEAKLKLANLGYAVGRENRELSLVAWDRLSAGDCIALTTASGQKLSFRIVGAQSGEGSRLHSAEASPNIDLAITACAPSSDAILKAVIETKAEPKASVIQRNL